MAKIGTWRIITNSQYMAHFTVSVMESSSTMNWGWLCHAFANTCSLRLSEDSQNTEKASEHQYQCPQKKRNRLWQYSKFLCKPDRSLIWDGFTPSARLVWLLMTLICHPFDFTCFGTVLDTSYQLLKLLWLRITYEGSVPKICNLSILLIKSDLKWCIQLSRVSFVFMPRKLKIGGSNPIVRKNFSFCNHSLLRVHHSSTWWIQTKSTMTYSLFLLW